MAHEYDSASPTIEIDGSNASKQHSIIDKENLVKPEKVKSRWRRNSEMETQETNSDESSSKDVDNNDVCENSKNVPTFKLLEENLYLFERKRTKRKKEVRRMLCECTVKEPGEIGCKDECLNRLLMIECGSRCATGEACSNKRFQKLLYAKTEPFKTKNKGWGLRILEDVQRGEFIIEYMGEVLNSAEFRRRVKLYARDKRKHYYFMALKIDEIIDASQKGNLSRFINHSCDPNIETQKWTVDGELRIGFFAKYDIKAGEELTFDYQLERYGQEAQTCYCNSENCKGYIGASDEITLDVDTNKKEKNKRRKYVEKDKEEKEKRREVLEDLMLEKEIQKLTINGVKNKDHTLMLARLMVRAEDSHAREKLLDIILSSTEVACLRLFLDYHGLTLLWSWMAYLRENNVLKTKILKVLSLLPVPNKTMLLDSKVLNIIETWASCVSHTSELKMHHTLDSLGDKELEFAKAKSCDTSDSETDGFSSQTSEHSGAFSSSSDKIHNCDENMVENDNSTPTLGSSDAEEPAIYIDHKRSDDESGDNTFDGEKNSESEAIKKLAQNLLASWKDLKEVFRIPRREKKQGDDINIEQTYNKEHVIKNQSKKEVSLKENNDETFSVEEKPQEIKVVLPFQRERRYSNCTSSRKIREERRALFAEKVLQKEKMHRERRKNASFSHSNISYIPPHSDLTNNGKYEFVPSLSGTAKKLNPYGHTHQQENNYFRPPLLATPRTEPISQTHIYHGPPQPADANIYPPSIMYPPSVSTENFKVPLFSLPPPPLSIPVATPDLSVTPITPCQTNNLAPHLINMPPVVSSPIVPMQISGSSEPTATGYVCAQSKFLCEEKSVLYMGQSTFPTSEIKTYQVVEENGEGANKKSSFQTKATYKLPPNWKTATDSEGNTYFYDVISRESQWEPPGLEENSFDTGTPTFDEPKEHKRETYSRRSHKKHSKKKSTTTAPADTSSRLNGEREISKKIKELFRTKMSSYVVQCLNPYQRDDCKVGRILSNEDFKHLARKLTHFVMAKELKHCKDVEDLEVNESVKLKAKDYIRKYMSRYKPVYRKEKSVSL